ncbi:MAG: polymer-forming cytoskeletal protein [Anditalea sp.]
MWNKEKKTEELINADSTSFFAKGFRLVGNIDANSDIRIEGTVEGNIKTSKKVIIGTTGSVIGNVNATNISLMGEVSGDIYISGLAKIGETAKINGTITADKLQIEPGSIIEAEIKRFSASTNEKPVNKAVMKGIKNFDDKENYPMAKAL